MEWFPLAAQIGTKNRPRESENRGPYFGNAPTTGICGSEGEVRRPRVS